MKILFRKFLFFLKNESLTVLSLYVVLIVLFVFFVSGAIIASCSQKKAGVSVLNQSLKSVAQVQQSVSDEKTVFLGLGRIRAITKDEPPKTLILSPFFSYLTSDTPFLEELTKKCSVLKGCIVDWFKNYTGEEILSLSEDYIKSEIARILNEKLVLEQIDELFFEEFLLIE